MGITEKNGSSPHTRGARGAVRVGQVGRGIIPAYAGSTPRRRRSPAHPGDHPRIRGEHTGYAIAVDVRDGSSPHTRGAPSAPSVSCPSGGSSPHTRGAQVPVSLLQRRAWIIPAYAGSTLHHHEIISCSRGSSPHTRGARLRGLRCRHIVGIIPAYAGSTRTPTAFPV